MALSRRFFTLGGAAATAELLQGCASVQKPMTWQELFAQHGAALRLSKTDPIVTVGFEQLAQDRSLKLQDIRKSVGLLLVPPDKDKASLKNDYLHHPLDFLKELARGSAVLLDKEGTVVFCAHQVHNKHAGLAFFPEPSVRCAAPVEIILESMDKEKDFVFGKIMNPSIIDKFGLLPVQWGERLPGKTEDKRIALTGFVMGNRLHTTLGEFVSYEHKVQTDKGVFACKLLTSNPDYRGDSGGLASRSGKFVGIINAEHHIKESLQTASYLLQIASYITPVEVIQAAYVKFFPEIAARAGVTVPRNFSEITKLHPECSLK